ncbi:MAG: PAS domain-containing protein [Verrucomicrobiota bacterium]
MLRRAERLARMGSWHWDVASNTLIWSDELCRIYGVAPGTPLTFEMFIEHIHPADRAQVQATVAAALKDGKPFQLQERIVRPDGEIRVLDSQGEVERDAAGNTVAMFGLCRDVTEEQRAREAMREREQRFAKMFHASPVATSLMTVAEGRFVDANPRFLDITGYTPAELIGRAAKVLSLWGSPDERARFLEQLRESGSLREVSIRYCDRAGQERRALASIELIEIDGEDCLLTLLWRA